MENLVSHCSGVSSTRLNNFGAFCKSGYSPVYRFCIFQTLLPLRKWSEVRPGVLEAVLFGQNFHPEFHAEFLVFVVFSKSFARQIGHV